jgi:predicted ATPase
MDLLERTSFLHTLAEYAGAAKQGDGRLVLVSGESGIGKTALVETFQQEATGARWLWGACDRLLTPRPLGPLFDIGAQTGGQLDGLCRREAHRDQLFAAFLAEIHSPGALTVVVIEDVHWADEATIDLLSFVGRRLGRMSALLLATYRDDEVGDDHPLRVVLGNLATQRATRRMRLPPLSAEAVRAGCRGFGQRPVPERACRIRRPISRSRSHGSWRPTGAGRPRRGTGFSGLTMPPWPDWVRRMRPYCGRPSQRSTTSAPGQPRRRPGGG